MKKFLVKFSFLFLFTSFYSNIFSMNFNNLPGLSDPPSYEDYSNPFSAPEAFVTIKGEELNHSPIAIYQAIDEQNSNLINSIIKNYKGAAANFQNPGKNYQTPFMYFLDLNNKKNENSETRNTGLDKEIFNNLLKHANILLVDENHNNIFHFLALVDPSKINIFLYSIFDYLSYQIKQKNLDLSKYGNLQNYLQQKLLGKKNNEGFTPIEQLVAFQRINGIEFLSDNGFDINFVTEKETNALFQALFQDEKEDLFEIINLLKDL